MKEPFEHCLHCKHLLLFEGEGGCKAFPGDIPSDYAQGIKIHNKIDKNQVGEFIFEEGESYFEIESQETDNYLNIYIEKYPKEFQTVMSGTYAFGDTEMQQILKVALAENKKFNLRYDKDKFKLDGAFYKLTNIKKK